jgi:hypothetical protein
MCRSGKEKQGQTIEKAIANTSRPGVSPEPHQGIHSAASNRDNPSPQPRAVQQKKRRQSGKGPAGDGADLVPVQDPVPAKKHMSKRFVD